MYTCFTLDSYMQSNLCLAFYLVMSCKTGLQCKYKVICLQGKTPVSHLQELCNKWGIVPLYELVASEGPTHEPVFEFSVKAREYSATGRGCCFVLNEILMTNLYLYECMLYGWSLFSLVYVVL